MRTELERLRRFYNSHVPSLLGKRQEYAVLYPLVERADGLHLLFEVRASGIRQGGETCFPGGRMEPGETPAVCALRETEEELAIPPAEIHLLGEGDFICNQQGFLLRPVVGLVSPTGFDALRPAPAEVAETYTVPLDFFRSTPPERYTYALTPQVPDTFPYEAVGIPRDYAWACGRVEVPVWQYHEHVIWGMTARLVSDLIVHL